MVGERVLVCEIWLELSVIDLLLFGVIFGVVFVVVDEGYGDVVFGVLMCYVVVDCFDGVGKFVFGYVW